MIGYFLLAILGVIVVVITIRTLRFTRQEKKFVKVIEPAANIEKLAEKLQHAIQIKTISYADKDKIDYGKFLELHQSLEKDFPLIHDQLEKIVINKYSLLFRWKGCENSGLPSLFMAHQDVVPVSEKTSSDWEEEPFSGAIKDGYVWGRGALDTKNTLICSMEAVESLLDQGYELKNDIYLAFGHDEEIQSDGGAYQIAKYLEENNIRLGFIMDEGGIVSVDSIPGMNQAVGLIGIGEKGSLDLKVTMSGEEGHSSMPPKHTAIGRISQLVVDLENNPMPMKLLKPAKEFLMVIGPKMGILNRVILSNLWLFKPLFMFVFSKSNTGNAMLRTTLSATMSEGSPAPNILPSEASITFNSRIGLDDSVNQVISHIKKIAGKYPVRIDIIESKEPSKISETDSEGFRLIKETVPEIFGHVLVAPYIVMAATDSHHYEKVCDHIYRFAPMKLKQEQLATIHGSNERISFENLERCMSFYKTLIGKLDSLS